MDFITPEEKAQLEARLNQLKANRPVISERIAEARALGDLKENAEYHAAREDQGLEEAEIRRLEERISTAQVIDKGSTPDDIVFLGATVRLREVDTGDEDLYRLVGESSGNAAMLDYVEVTASSPMGESLMKARLGDVVKVDAPKGVIRFEVVEIL
ncbi:MAG: transcription elongation factor GreA [Phycisphaerales bacterium]|nr:transcription elongation factor GreA [Phycisphaerales bacterium]